MDLKNNLKLIIKIDYNKNKKTINNGKNGKKIKKRNQIKFNKELKKSMLKTINYGKILILQNKPIGNKKITLIGYNGQLKSKPEKLTIYKKKKEINNINKKIKKEKNKKTCKNISDKFNSVII